MNFYSQNAAILYGYRALSIDNQFLLLLSSVGTTESEIKSGVFIWNCIILRYKFATSHPVK